MTREEVVKWLESLKRETGKAENCALWHYAESIDMAIKALSPEDRPTGEWIKATGMMPPEFHGHHCCSECGNFANMEPPFGNREDLSKFCPNCGSYNGGKRK